MAYSISRFFKEITHLFFGQSAVVAEMASTTISCVSWKDDKMLCAIAFPDSSICFYDLEKQCWRQEMLTHNQMVGIQSICWKPLAPNTLVVSCVNGVFLWNIIKQNQGVHCIYSLEYPQH